MNEVSTSTRRIRTAAEDAQCAYHEAGHAVVRRALGKRLAGLTIDAALATKLAGQAAGGLCWGPGKGLVKLEHEKFSDTAMHDRLRDYAPLTRKEKNVAGLVYVDVHQRVVECAAGTAAEELFCDQVPPVHAASDIRDAMAEASWLCGASSRAINAFLDFGKIQAAEILSAHKGAVTAIAEALIEKKTLNAKQVDRCIAVGEAQDALATERLRRRQWSDVIAGAEAFKTHCISGEYKDETT
jgi:hypothetical protein